MKQVAIILGILLGGYFLSSAQPVYAEQKASASSAMLACVSKKPIEDKRVQILKGYLKRYESPLAESADTFVKQADEYKLDWKLVASIAGVESSFAHHLPYNSHNAWGWGIYGTNSHSFESYDEAIKIISKSLREDYMDKWGAQNVYQIGGFYAEDPAWAYKVTHFMEDLEKYSQSSKHALSISI